MTKQINIKYEVLKRLNITLEEYMALLLVHLDCNYEVGINGLVEKGYITRYGPKNRSGWFTSQNGDELIALVQSESSFENAIFDRALELAKKLKPIFPKGKKDGTNYYWAEGVLLIAKRLVIFFRKYGDKFTDEQIVDATQRYVASFNGNYIYMQLLKYFIFKDAVGAGGEVESKSELLNMIENKDEDNTLYRNDFGELR